MSPNSIPSKLKINSQGWLNPARHCPSPHFNQRPSGSRIRLLVIHNISLPPSQYGGGYIESFFLGKLNKADHPYFEEIADLKVSAHLLINRKGEITQFVSFMDRAWHAGVSAFNGVANCNDFSLGIELEGADDQDYTEEQYLCLAEVTQALQDYFPDLKDIVGHSDIAPGRKTDPGDSFNWKKYFQLMR